MATLRELVTKLSFVTDTKPLDKVNSAIAGIKSRLNLLVGIEALKGLASLTDQFGTFALDLRNTAAAAGLTTDEFQKLSYAAAQSGINQEALGSTLKSLNKKLYDARMGSEQAALAFANSGVPPEQLGSFHNAEDALYALGRSLNQIQDPVRRAALAQEMLGDQGAKLLASLNATAGGLAQLSRSADANASVITDTQLEALVRSEQALVGLRQQATTLSQQLAASLAPSITKAFGALSKFLSANRELIRTTFKRWAVATAGVLGTIVGAFQGAYDVALRFYNKLLDFDRKTGLFTSLKKDLEFVGRFLKEVFVLVFPAALGAIEAVFTTVVSLTAHLQDLGGALGAVGAAFSKIFTGPWRDILKNVNAFFVSIAHLATEIGRTGLGLVNDGLNITLGYVKDIFKLLFGYKFEDSFLGKFVNLGQMIANGASNLFGGRSYTDKDGNLVGTPGAPASGPQFDMMQMQGASPLLRPAGPTFGAAGQAGSSSSVINAPITINIEGNAETKPVLQAVQDGIADSHDKLLRQTQAASTPGMWY